jgi:hypothetical protein
LTRNAVKCLQCGDEVESKHRHDFVGCSCGSVFTDGGLEYQRIGYMEDGAGYTNLAEYEQPE